MGTLSLLVTMGNRSVRPHASECCCVADSCYAPSSRRARALELVLKREPEGRHVSFPMLETVYQPNNKVFFFVKGHKAAGRIKESHYGTGCGGDHFTCVVSVLLAGGVEGCTESSVNIYVGEYIGERAVNELPVRPCTPLILSELTERGRRFSKLAVGKNHVGYRGNAFVDTRSTEKGMENFNANGRVMLDPETFGHFNPNYAEDEEDGWMKYARREMRNEVDEATADAVAFIEEEDLWRTWPSIKGFALSVKRWGEFFVDQMVPITYHASAFDTLVLDPEKKAMVVAAVANTTREDSFSDIVDGKGGGCVLLLHGPPGVGKTLTAEATAEYLRRPLYTLTSGELGTTPTELEENLSRVLELTSIWDAVLLIDECDIFLQQRNGEDVMRNAMVGIFLRLLEYHHGILFLTTNRVDVFDTAVYSRISVALEYSFLDIESRHAVWASLLQAASVSLESIDLTTLAHIPANGRQIKNAVRLALALAKGAAPLSTTQFEQAVRVAQDFNTPAAKQQLQDPPAISACGATTA